MNSILALFVGIVMFVSMVLFMFFVVYVRRMFGILIKKIDIVIKGKNKSSDSQKNNK
jgi:hypothetical protein